MSSVIIRCRTRKSLECNNSNFKLQLLKVALITASIIASLETSLNTAKGRLPNFTTKLNILKSKLRPCYSSEVHMLPVKSVLRLNPFLPRLN